MAAKGTGSATEAIQARTAELAYAIWEREGRPHGRDEEHWRMAEAELTGSARTTEKASAKAAGASAKTASRSKRAAQAEARI